MKHPIYLLLSLALIFSAQITHAQQDGMVSEITLTTPQGEQPGFEYFIPDTDESSVLNAWSKFHRNFKAKAKQDKGLRNYYFTDNATIPMLSENTVDIYTRIYSSGNGVRFACAFDLGGVFVSARKTPDKYKPVVLLLNQFYTEIAMEALLAEIEKEMAALAELRTEYDAIEREISGYEAQAQTYRSEIAGQEAEQQELAARLETREQELLDGRKELAGQKAELERLDATTLVADLAAFNSDLKKTVLETARIEKDVERKEAEIASIRAEIDLLNNDLTEKKEYQAQLQMRIGDMERRIEELRLDDRENDMELLENRLTGIEKAVSDLNARKTSVDNSLEGDRRALERVERALELSRETRGLLEGRIAEREARLRELELMRASGQ